MDVREAARGALRGWPTPAGDDSSLPYNRSWEGSRVFGGKQINAGFGASAIAGTNWDCKHPTFNYEASALAHANVSAFGYEKEAMRAEAQYGKIGGSPLDDVISLVVWGKPVYSKSLPAPDCSPHTHQLYHKAPGPPSLHHQCTINAPPLHHHCTITAPSPQASTRATLCGSQLYLWSSLCMPQWTSP